MMRRKGQAAQRDTACAKRGRRYAFRRTRSEECERWSLGKSREKTGELRANDRYARRGTGRHGQQAAAGSHDRAAGAERRADAAFDDTGAGRFIVRQRTAAVGGLMVRGVIVRGRRSVRWRVMRLRERSACCGRTGAIEHRSRGHALSRHRQQQEPENPGSELLHMSYVHSI